VVTNLLFLQIKSEGKDATGKGKKRETLEYTLEEERAKENLEEEGDEKETVQNLTQVQERGGGVKKTTPLSKERGRKRGG